MTLNSNIAYVKSAFAQNVQNNETAIIWHSLFGNPKIVSLDTINFLNSFSEPLLIRTIFEEGISEDNLIAINELIDSHYLVQSDFDERSLLQDQILKTDNKITDGSLVDYLELIMSESCNFRCKYCIHFCNLENSDRINNPEKFMQFDTAKKAVDEYINIIRKHNKTVAEINFGGGEPLMAWPVINQILEYCIDQYGSNLHFNFSINTNLSLITEEMALVLKKYKVEIATSLDGLQEGNDSVRLTKGGNGTYSKIVSSFHEMDNIGYPIKGFSATITEDNFEHLDLNLIDWAFDHDMKDVRIDIDVIGMVNIPLENITSKLLRIRNYAETKGIDIPGFWARPSENLNESALEYHVGFCGGIRGNSLCISPTGNIYCCGYSNLKLGHISNVQELFSTGSTYRNLINGRVVGMLDMCKGCIIEGQCGGGCNITQEYAQFEKTSKIERMCDFYKEMTRQILLNSLV